MTKIISKISSFIACDSGVTLVEYGLALVLAVTVGTTALMALSGGINANLEKAETEMSSSL